MYEEKISGPMNFPSRLDYSCALYNLPRENKRVEQLSHGACNSYSKYYSDDIPHNALVETIVVDRELAKVRGGGGNFLIYS